MKTMTMYGASDDLIEIGGVPGADEFYAEGLGDDLVQGSFILGGRMRIRVLYDGCWSFAISQLDEGFPIPEWPIRITNHERGYSILLEIDVPDDVAIFREAVK